jgi:catechol 2,3-dioxygenase-like lactoylglutathione lyase family enzyme
MRREQKMTVMNCRRSTEKVEIADVAGVAVPVSDQEAAVQFYTTALGLEVRLDVPMGESGRWVQVGAPGGRVGINLVAVTDGGPVGVDTGITFATPDAEADHAALGANGVQVDALLRWPGVPPMFAFRDLDGNQLKVMQAAP